MTDTQVKRYRFGDYSFDPQKLELEKDGIAVLVKLQPARLLQMLLEGAPGTISRRTLQTKIWNNGTIVEFEQGLNACINQLRTALGESASAPLYISTQPKRGYKFIAPVEIEYASIQNNRWWIIAFACVAFIAMMSGLFLLQQPTDETLPKRIYVAPVQISDASLIKYFDVAQYALRLGTVARLMHEDLEILQTINGTTLWNNPDLPKIGIVIDYTLFLTLAWADDGYQVEALIIGDTNQEFDRQVFLTETLDPGSLSELSNEIAIWSSAVFGSPLGRESVTGPPRQHDPAYFEAMLRARRAFLVSDQASLRTSLVAFNSALVISPNSIDARGGKAMALTVLAGSDGFPAAETYEAALLIADDIRQSAGPTAQSELTRGYIYLYRDWNIEKSRLAFDLAVELAPGDASVHSWRAAVLAAQELPAEAAYESDLAVQLDPLSMAITGDRCWFLGAADRFEEAVSACNWVLEMKPSHDWARMGLVIALDKLGRSEEALQAFMPIIHNLRAARTKSSSHEPGIAKDNPEPVTLLAAYCEIADIFGRASESGNSSQFLGAVFNAQCGRHELAADYLERAIEGGESGVLFYAIDPRLDTFRVDPAATRINMQRML